MEMVNFLSKKSVKLSVIQRKTQYFPCIKQNVFKFDCLKHTNFKGPLASKTRVLFWGKQHGVLRWDVFSNVTSESIGHTVDDTFVTVGFRRHFLSDVTSEVHFRRHVWTEVTSEPNGHYVSSMYRRDV